MILYELRGKIGRRLRANAKRLLDARNAPRHDYSLFACLLTCQTFQVQRVHLIICILLDVSSVSRSNCTLPRSSLVAPALDFALRDSASLFSLCDMCMFLMRSMFQTLMMTILTSDVSQVLSANIRAQMTRSSSHFRGAGKTSADYPIHTSAMQSYLIHRGDAKIPLNLEQFADSVD